MNETFTVRDQSLCTQCTDKWLKERFEEEVLEGSVVAQQDPTVCAWCGADNGSVELPTVAGAPVCEACQRKLLRPPLPLWVKLAFLAVLALASVETVRNWRLFQAYFEIPRAYRAFDEGKIEEAHELIARAAKHVPEYGHLAAEEKLLRGICLLGQGKPEEAIPALRECRDEWQEVDNTLVEYWLLIAQIQYFLQEDQSAKAIPLIRELKHRFPQDAFADQYLLHAQIGDAFEKKDYDAFLTKAREWLRQAPDNPIAWAQVGSAMACKYAVTGDETFRKECMAHLEKARQLAGEAADYLREYEERILHRLESREIISRKEYDRRYRQGAKKGETR